MLKEQSEKSKYDKLVELFGEGGDGDLTASGADPGREIRVAQKEQEFLEKKAQEIAEQKVEALIKQGALSYPFWLALRDEVILNGCNHSRSATAGYIGRLEAAPVIRFCEATAEGNATAA